MTNSKIEIHHDGVHVADVAMVDGINDVDSALEYAWRWTNNVEGSWSQGPTLEWEGRTERNGDYNAHVTRLVPLHVNSKGRTMGLRSSMTGDRFVVVDRGQRRSYRVAFCGFEEVVG